jgi:hypothetical protein
MSFSLEEYPRFVTEDVFGYGYDTWFGVGGGFEDFVGDVAVRCEDDESEKELWSVHFAI